ncbi:hypothetical protein N7537_009763 [Penicillium hordei]|uniref:Uncharacterized protein n=1 Tax=Penicillium hordei TaxID=40994 RepID=A0AAD6GY41_9EURO|nr:uncharacterized protein N7537_009763 [Penicillium hordei]KAJ5592859.1 hypothetical protein N7537_009763 [Penicillium hordei]
MSTEDAPWILALDGVECRICGHSIKLQYAAEDPKGPGAWRGYSQDLQLASQQPVPQALVPAELCSSTFHSETRTMHAACWKIIEGIWKSEFTMAELDGFLDVSSDLAPFLPEMPYKVSPIEIDAGLTWEGSGQTSHRNGITISASEGFLTTLETEGLEKPLLPDMRYHALPPDLDRHVRRWLSDSEAEDVESLRNPTLGYWSSVARMLENHPQFSNVPPAEVAEDITQTLKHLYDRGLGCFPHLANYDAVHANAMTILLTLLKLPLEDIQGAPDLKGKRARLQLSRSIQLPPALDTPAKLKLQLSTLRRQNYAEGSPNRSNLRVGMKYLHDIWFGPPDADIAAEPGDVVVEVPSFAGLRFVRDHLGVFAVLAKQGEMWHSCWQQDPTVRWQEGMPGTESTTVVEWQAGMGQPSFLIASDTYRDLMLLDQNSSKKEKNNSKRKKLKQLFKLSKD